MQRRRARGGREALPVKIVWRKKRAEPPNPRGKKWHREPAWMPYAVSLLRVTNALMLATIIVSLWLLWLLNT